jgi:nucleoside diphosphate kinase
MVMYRSVDGEASSGTIRIDFCVRLAAQQCMAAVSIMCTADVHSGDLEVSISGITRMVMYRSVHGEASSGTIRIDFCVRLCDASSNVYGCSCEDCICSAVAHSGDLQVSISGNTRNTLHGRAVGCRRALCGECTPCTSSVSRSCAVVVTDVCHW